MRLFKRNNDLERETTKAADLAASAEMMDAVGAAIETIDNHLDESHGELDELEARLADIKARHEELAAVDLRLGRPVARRRGSVQTLDLRTLMSLHDEDPEFNSRFEAFAGEEGDATARRWLEGR